MLSDATSGLSCSAGCSRSSIVIVAAPPVVKLSTTFERRLISGANSRKYFGSCVGLPSTGSRACRCTIAAPASRGADRGLGDFLRRHRQVRRHRRRVDRAGHGAGDDDFAALGHDRRPQLESGASRLCCRSASRRASRQRMRASRSAALARRFELARYMLHVRGVPHGRRRRIGGERAIEAGVARAIIGDTARRVELDRRERPDERPAQTQAVLDRLVEVLRRHVALADEAQRFGQQRALQAIQDEAVELALDDDRHLADLGHHRARALDRRGVGPRRAAQLDHGHEMRRIDRMRDEAARASGKRPR